MRHALDLASNECALIRREGNTTIIEVMQFFMPTEAKHRARVPAARPERKREPTGRRLYPNWQAEAVAGTRMLLDALERTGVRP
jgi:hypothetical protein